MANPPGWAPTSVTVADWGRFQIVVGGVDVTHIRGVLTTIDELTWEEPFGPGACTLRFLQYTGFDTLPSWMALGSVVDIYKVAPNGSQTKMWEGFVTDTEDENIGNQNNCVVLTCAGELQQANYAIMPPRFQTTSQDIGTLIKSAFDGVVSRRYGTMARVTTSIQSAVRPAWQTRLAYVQELLATATTTAGRQWTVALNTGRVPVLKLKDTTTVNWVVTYGTSGVEMKVKSSLLSAPNVIYGEGINLARCHWRNTKYPRLHSDDAKAYPFSNPSNTITIGTTDASTTSGTGVSDWQSRMIADGYGHLVTVTGTYNTNDQTACREIQTKDGLTVDGIVGPQTWAATFAIGTNGASLASAYFAPLAEKTNVDPYYYTASGAVTGKNPNYNRNTMRVERYENFGAGVSKSQGINSAKNELTRDASPGYQGTITLTIDPESGSRWDIRAGQNIQVKSFHGSSVLFHIAKVSAKPVGKLAVELTVDTNARDALTLGAIIARNYDAADPTRRLTQQRRRSRLVSESAVFDCENGAGLVPKHALFGGLWTVLQIPFGEYGSIVKSVFTTTSPATKFAIGVFSSRITPADLNELVGNPLSSTSAWSTNSDKLLAAGLQIAWGQSGQGAGFYPNSESGGGAVTGRLVDNASWEYASASPPWVWVAEYSPVSCFISGSFTQAGDD